MKLLFEIKKFDSSKVIHREAARAIIFKNEKLAMVKSHLENFYKFPGGGIEKGEDHIEVLIRETREEIGLTINPTSIIPFGYTVEKRKSIYNEEEGFEHVSFYYFADALDLGDSQQLDKYEEELEYELAYVDLETAYLANIKKQDKFPYLERELRVIKLLIDKKEKEV